MKTVQNEYTPGCLLPVDLHSSRAKCAESECDWPILAATARELIDIIRLVPEHLIFSVFVIKIYLIRQECIPVPSAA